MAIISYSSGLNSFICYYVNVRLAERQANKRKEKVSEAPCGLKCPGGHDEE